MFCASLCLQTFVTFEHYWRMEGLGFLATPILHGLLCVELLSSCLTKCVIVLIPLCLQAFVTFEHYWRMEGLGFLATPILHGLLCVELLSSCLTKCVIVLNPLCLQTFEHVWTLLEGGWSRNMAASILRQILQKKTAASLIINSNLMMYVSLCFPRIVVSTWLFHPSRDISLVRGLKIRRENWSMVLCLVRASFI